MDPASLPPEHLADALDHIRETERVNLTEDGPSGRYWSLTRYEDVRAAGMDRRLSSSAENGGISLTKAILPIRRKLEGEERPGWSPLPMMMSADGRRHAERRRMQAPHYTGERVAETLAGCADRTTEVLDALPSDETFDWTDRVSTRLAGSTLCALMHLPHDQTDRLVRLSEATLVAAQLAEGDPRSERRRLYTHVAMLSAHAGGGIMEDFAPRGSMEFIADLLLTIVAGTDTTRHSMSAGAVSAAAHPDMLDAIASGILPAKQFVDESLRWQTPISYMRRTATEDIEMHGRTIPKGDAVALWYLGANRDPRTFPSATAFDPVANAGIRHLGFGHGPHRCIGAHLAEVQLKLLWSGVAERFSSIEVVEEPTRIRSTFIRGWPSLKVRLTRR